MSKSDALAYVAALVIFLVMDFIWLGTVAKGLYQSEIGSLLLPNPDLVAAGIFYLLYVVGMVIFAIHPALADGDWLKAGLYGALFGLFCYATYDLSNLATLKGWSTTIVVVDIVWGMVVTGVSCAGATLVTRLVLK